MPLDRNDVENLSPEEKKAYIDSLLGSNKSKKPMFTTGWPDPSWHIIPGLFGLPVERQSRAIKHPAIILSIIAILIFIFWRSETAGLEKIVIEYGYIPDYWYRNFFLTMLTSFFLHGGWMHLLGNLYYFYIFGDDVEDELGLFKFLVLLFGSHIFGIIAHGLIANQGQLPLVGASAGISGLMGYYLVRFPKRQISYMAMFFFVYVLWIHVPAYLALLWKFGWELLIVGTTNGRYTNVAHWAHLGGAIFGGIFAFSQNEIEKEPIV